MNDAEFLQWLRDRLVHVYGESPNLDFVQKLGRVADSVDELTRQRDDARALAVKSGIFQDHFAEVYPQAHEEQPPVGPVAWDRQEQQR